MKLPKQHATAEDRVAPTRQDKAASGGSNESLAAQLQNSPRMVAQAQRTAASFGPAAVQAKQAENRTGLPDQLKAGVEALSGMSLDHVKVHTNSAKPAQLNALAYAQGSDIHVAPGQEKHLPHEAWHVVQQAQGRVQPTTQMGGAAVNDDVGLEAEADAMGAKAVSQRFADGSARSPAATALAQTSAPVQRETPPPTTHISLEDFVSHAEGEGCVSTSRDSGDFVGAPGGGYPHIHVWTNGKIALSVGHNRNYKIGEGGSIDIVKLGEELARGVPAGGLLNTIQWVLASAS